MNKFKNDECCLNCKYFIEDDGNNKNYCNLFKCNSYNCEISCVKYVKNESKTRAENVVRFGDVEIPEKFYYTINDMSVGNLCAELENVLKKYIVPADYDYEITVSYKNGKVVHTHFKAVE